MQFYVSEVPQVEKQDNIDEAKRAVQFLQQFLGSAEGKNAPAGKRVPTLGDFDFPLWNDQVIMKALGISSKTVYRRRQDKKFKPIPIGGIFYYWRTDILPFIDEYMK